MSDPSYYPYVGSGKIYTRVAGSAAGKLELGNASKIGLKVKEDKKPLKDYTKTGGGNYASVSRIDTVTLEIKAHDLNKTNIARAVFGTEAVVTGAAVLDEVITAYKGGLCTLAHPAPTAVVVTDSAGTTTYVQNTDYEVRPGGIFILAAGVIPDGAILKVDYSFATYFKVEALTSSAQIIELFFEGLNEANSGKPVLVDVYRAQLSPAKALELLGDNFADLDIEAEVLKDTTKTGVGISQYFRVRGAMGA
jgi:hypothetical protein